MAPVRMSNLVKLDIERNLCQAGQASEALHIVLGAEEVKNREPLEYPLPPESVDLLERYIRDFRPHLTSAGNTALFPGIGGGPKNQAFFGTQISANHTGTHRVTGPSSPVPPYHCEAFSRCQSR
jgi:integrase